MITRTLTIQSNPNVQITLYYNSRSNVEKVPHTDPSGNRLFEDDYKQSVGVAGSAVILTDLITDVKEMLLSAGEMEVLKMMATKKLQERIDADPLLKVWIEMQNRKRSGGGMMMPSPQVQV